MTYQSAATIARLEDAYYARLEREYNDGPRQYYQTIERCIYCLTPRAINVVECCDESDFEQAEVEIDDDSGINERDRWEDE